jgi:hypothetical protein
MALRYNKIERLFLDAISANNIEMLETIITDENAMFDVLGDFFYHVNHQVSFRFHLKSRNDFSH